MQCIGYHEETHVVAHFLNEPSSSALSEGIAVCMDKTWWGVDIRLCTNLYLSSEKYVSVEALICNKQENGKSTFINLYSYQGDNWREEIENVYNCPFPELEAEFLDYINRWEYSEEEIYFGKKRLGLQ